MPRKEGSQHPTMSEISMEEGISRARSQLGVGSLTPARAWRIRRVDQPGEVYYLVVFGEVQASIGVAAVDAVRGEVMTSATLPGKGPHLAIDAKTAVQLSGLPIGAQVELIWKPCRASLSLLYPIWQVSSRKKTIYIDQQGVVWQELVAAGPGG
jgi:hypothetical protein